MSGPLGPIQTIKADVSEFLRVARERHRRGENPFRVVQGLSDGIDGILRQLFLQVMDEVQERVALVAVGGYGRRELCPYSDIDLLFLHGRDSPDERIERLVRLLWDGGFQLGHAVRTPAECFRFMTDDSVTATTMLENRFLAGSGALYERFEATAVNRYRKRRGESFAREKLSRLGKSLFDPGRTIYVLEPHLKDGCSALRDIQRVLWIENIRRGQSTFEAIARGGAFSEDEIWRLREAYGFYLRLRCELHFTNGLKQDILERDSLPDIARNLGYEGTPLESAEKLMGDYYRHSRSVYRFLRHYLETGTRGRRFFGKLSHKLFRRHENPYLVVEKASLFLADGGPDALGVSDEKTAEKVMEIFLIAHRDDLKLSESACGWIRRKLESLPVDFTHSPAVYDRFVEILRGGRNVGRVLKSMHEAGVLARALPEFAALDGLVSFGGHHQFTVDEHILRALEELDRVEAGAKGVEPEFREVLAGIEDRTPLRLALLLHDIGKGMPGDDHSASGTEAAMIACERLGLDDRTAETVEFLIYRHLWMFRMSERRDFGEDGVVESFARLVGTPERLRMLYLLTYIDITAVGPGTWTSWKGAQLSELYRRTMICLETGTDIQPDLEEALLAAGLEPRVVETVLDHCAKIDSAVYTREIVPQRMLDHVELLDRLRAIGDIQLRHQSFGGYDEITVCCPDRPHLFADLAGVLFSEGLNLLGARIFSRSDGVAIDMFWVEIADGVHVDMEERVRRIRRKLRRIESKEVVVEDIIRQWMRSYRFRRLQPRGTSLHPPRVAFDNRDSDLSTVIEIDARDRPGLLYDLASALGRLGLDVRMAKVSTLTDRAHDVFYVVEADGQKVTNPARMKEIEQMLLQETRSSSTVLAQGGS